MEIDVFVVHSKSDSQQASMYDSLRGQAAKCDLKVLTYDDWEWERKGERILDVREAAYRESDPYEQLPGRINKEILTRLWELSSVLIVLNPTRSNKVGPGARCELKKLPAFYAKHRRRRTPIPLVLNVGHEQPRSFPRIPIAESVSIVDVTHPPSCANAFALLALTWLIYEIESFRGLSGYLLAPSQIFGEPLLSLVHGRKIRLPVETVDESIDSAVLSAVPKLMRFWEREAQKVRMWFSLADHGGPYVQAARSFISVIEARLQERH